MTDDPEEQTVGYLTKTTDRSRLHRIWRLLVGVLVVALVATMPAAALASLAAEEIELGGTLRTGDDVTVPVDETFDGNLYAFAGQISIEGTIDGDVVASGGQIDVDGTITGDLLVFAGQVTVSGDVNGDIRFVGGQLTVPGDVGGDIAMVGGAGDIDGAVGSDLLFGVGQMTLTGDVDGDVYGAGGDYQRSGSIGGEERVTLPTPDDEPTVGDRIVDVLLRTISVFVVGAFALLLVGRPLNQVLDRVRSRPLRCLLFGLLALAALLVGVVAAIVIGIVLSILFAVVGLNLLIGTYWFVFITTIVVMAALLFLVGVFGAPIVTALAATEFVTGRDAGLWVRLLALAGGVMIYTALTALPVIGGILSFLAFLLTLGAIAVGVRYINSIGRQPDPDAVGDVEYSPGAEAGAG